MPIKTYKDLNVFRESYYLALDVSRVTKRFPGPEQFELARQLRRAALSIPANIAEGWAKRSKLWLEMSRDEGFLTQAESTEFENKFNVLGAMLKSLWKQWKTFHT